MRELMKLVESMSPTLFHGTRKQFEVGDTLTPQEEGYAHGSHHDPIERKAHQFCEAVLERYRPRDATPRKEAVYMCDKPDDIDRAGGYEDHIYIVEPEGPVTRCNLYWYGTLEGFCMGFDDPNDADEQDLRTMAKGYWGCLPNDLDEPHRDLIEYLARAAKIVREI